MESEPELGMSISACIFFKDKPGDLSVLQNARTNDDDLLRFLRRDVPWLTTGPTWRREAYNQVHPWDENLPSWQDWEIHIRAILAKIPYRRIAEGTSHYRVDQKASIGDASHSPDHLRAQEALFLHVRGLLEKGGYFKDEWKAAVGGLYISLAMMWMENDRLNEARRVLGVAVEQKVLTPSQKSIAILYIRTMNIPVWQKILRKALKVFWPEGLFPWYSSTIRKTPVAHLENWADSAPRVCPGTSTA